MRDLFWHKHPYDIAHTDDIFLQKTIENAVFQFDNCDEYRRLMLSRGFSREKLSSLKSPAELPFIPTLYFKHHKLLSVPEKKLMIKATSSGTSGNKSIIGFDFKSLWAGLGMVLTVGRKHRLLSPVPCHYIVLGYEFNKHASMAVAKTAYGYTWFTPALSRTYALKYENRSYTLQLEHIKKQLIRLSRQKFPVRIIGFPFH
ncbi:MAG: acyl-protein synthetase, partial [Lachnospiraceae bacterium]|nr:acyl-protein synthetase [Lachnospiraceae bacterium]